MAKRTQYGKEGQSIVRFGDPRKPMTVVQARKVLEKVEEERSFVQIEDPSGLQVRGGKLYDGRTSLGTLTSHALFGLKHNSRAELDKTNNTWERAINHAISEGAFDEKPLQLRVVRETHQINAVVTGSYQHLPYDQLLEGFPKQYIVPRLQVDDRYLQVHVALPDSLVKKDDVFLGARILSSDVGLCRAMLLNEVLRLICLNGLMRSTVEVFFKRYHMQERSKPITSVWPEQIRAFLDNIPNVRKVEIARITAASKSVVSLDTARADLLRLGLGRVRVEAALAYAEREFGGLNRWSIAQGITHVSQFQRGEEALPTSIAVANDVDAIAAEYANAA